MNGYRSRVVIVIRKTFHDDYFLKANDHRDPKSQRFTFGTGERKGLFDKPDLKVVRSRNQVKKGERLSEAGKRAKRYILNAFKENGGIIKNQDTRHPITVTSKSASHLIHLGVKHTPYKQHVEAAFCLPELLRRAVLVERYKDDKDGNDELFIARYYVPFLCDSTLFRAKLTVFEYRGSDKKFKLYDHSLSEVVLEKINPAKSGAVRKGISQNGEQDHSSSTFDSGILLRSKPSLLSIRQLLSGCYRDGDGKPFGGTS